MDLRAMIQEARENKRFDEMVQAIPYSRFLGISVEEKDDQLVGKMSFSDKIIGNPKVPALHGGTIGALLESTAIFTVLWGTDTIVLPKTINITIDYLRGGKLADTFCVGTITKHGRRVANVRAEAWQESRDKLIASANAHFLISPPEE